MWGWTGSDALTFFFFFFFLFCFLYIFCKKVANQFKPIPNFFKKSAQCFKTVRKLVFSIQQDFQKGFINLAKRLCLHNQNRIRVLKNKPFEIKEYIL
jgi:predicted PurR-regulated permease PerM